MTPAEVVRVVRPYVAKGRLTSTCQASVFGSTGPKAGRVGQCKSQPTYQIGRWVFCSRHANEIRRRTGASAELLE